MTNSVAQKIRIKLFWFAEEWRWNPEEGLPYLEELLTKNPDTDSFESLIREKIFEVDEITEVNEVTITWDRQTRQAQIRFIVQTDQETIKEEVSILCME